MIPFVKYRKLYYSISGLLILVSLVGFILWGLNWGIDFRGGTSLSVEYENQAPSVSQVREAVNDLGFQGSNVQPIGKTQIAIQINRNDVSLGEKNQLIGELGKLGKMQEGVFSFQQISPIIGSQLKGKTITVAILSIIAILLYISWAFRKIYHPLPSWQYGLSALIALFHDVLIVIGVFILLGHFYGFQINIPSITALLVVFGYSVNDTVVVFDRIRENLLKSGDETYQEVVNASLNQTLVRSLNTSLTTLFVLLAIFFMGGVTLHSFALALSVGIVSGSYSSIFLASPILVSWHQWKYRSEK